MTGHIKTLKQRNKTPEMNLDIKKHFNCKYSGDSIHVGTRMDFDIDRRCSYISDTSSPTTEAVMMSQCPVGDLNVLYEVAHPSSTLLAVRHLYGMLNSRVKYLFNSCNHTEATLLSSVKPHNLLQDTIFTTIRSVSLLKSSELIPKMSLFVLLLTLALSFNQAEARSVGLCRGVPCANGGHLMVDNSVWGHCRCRCQTGFVGPYCQYQLTGRRSVVSTSLSNVRRRAPRSKRLEQIKQQLVVLAPQEISSSESEKRFVDSAMSSSSAGDDSSVISKILEAQNSNHDSSIYGSLSDPIWLLKNIRR